MEYLYQIYEIINAHLNFLVVVKATQLNYVSIYSRHYPVNLLLKVLSLLLFLM